MFQHALAFHLTTLTASSKLMIIRHSDVRICNLLDDSPIDRMFSLNMPDVGVCESWLSSYESRFCW